MRVVVGTNSDLHSAIVAGIGALSKADAIRWGQTGPVGRACGVDYDVRKAKLLLIVSSAKLPEFFDAVARTNFMTVTGIAMEKVDSWGELANGYYYGMQR